MTITSMGKARKEEQDVITIKKFNEAIPDERAAIAFVEEKLWGDTPRCGHCGTDNVYRVDSSRSKSHRCRPCKRYFNVRTNTVMASTQLPIRTWLLAIHFMHTARKGISALQLHKMLGTTYRTAWHLCHRIREAMKDDGHWFADGVVEVDETYVGGKQGNMHASKKSRDWTKNRTIVMGFKERETGKVIAFPVKDNRPLTLEGEVLKHVIPGTTVYSDGHAGYQFLNQLGFKHESVNHGAGEYVRGEVTTNGIESFWSLFKRGYMGVFHYMSPKHIHRYANEFAYRQSAGIGNGLRTIGGVLSGMEGRRLTYRALVGRA